MTPLHPERSVLSGLVYLGLLRNAGVFGAFPVRARRISPQFRLRGGEGGIRTPDTLSGMPVFKTGAINHSATSPTTRVLLQIAGFGASFTLLTLFECN